MEERWARGVRLTTDAAPQIGIYVQYVKVYWSEIMQAVQVGVAVRSSLRPPVLYTARRTAATGTNGAATAAPQSTVVSASAGPISFATELRDMQYSHSHFHGHQLR